jgi:hypothetical protein
MEEYKNNFTYGDIVKHKTTGDIYFCCGSKGELIKDSESTLEQTGEFYDFYDFEVIEKSYDNYSHLTNTILLFNNKTLVQVLVTLYNQVWIIDIVKKHKWFTHVNHLTSMTKEEVTKALTTQYITKDNTWVCFNNLYYKINIDNIRGNHVLLEFSSFDTKLIPIYQVSVLSDDYINRYKYKDYKSLDTFYKDYYENLHTKQYLNYYVGYNGKHLTVFRNYNPLMDIEYAFYRAEDAILSVIHHEESWLKYFNIEKRTHPKWQDSTNVYFEDREWVHYIDENEE